MKKIMFIFALLMSVGLFANASNGKVVSKQLKSHKFSSREIAKFWQFAATVYYHCSEGGPTIQQTFYFDNATDLINFRKRYPNGSGLSFTCP